MTILFTTKLPTEGFTPLQEHTLIFPEKPYFTHTELAERLPNADILVSTFDYSVPVEILCNAKKLKYIANFGSGFNNLPLDYCSEQNILITNTPQPVIEPTAEHCFALILGIAHRVAELDRRMREIYLAPREDAKTQSNATHQEVPIRFGVMENLGIGLYGKTLGIIGMGNIGQAVARRARAFGMNIIYHNRHRVAPDVEMALNAVYSPLDALLGHADIISLNLPYTPSTRHLINAESLAKMKPTALLINTARGAHICEDDLVQALENHVIAGAALDVYEHEPNISPALKALPNVLLSPHIGTGTWDGRLRMCECVTQNILAYLNNEPHKMNII